MPNFYGAPTWSKYLVLICSAGLLAIWALPGTIALRHAFLVLGFIASLFVLKEYLPHLSFKTSWSLWALVLLYCWLLIHLAFFSHEFTAQLKELRSVWARCLLASFIGVALGLLLSSTGNQNGDSSKSHASSASWWRWSTVILFIGFSAPCWITFGAYLVTMLQSGQGAQFDIYHFLYGLYRTKPAYVVLEVLALPLCFILLLSAIQQRVPKGWIPITLFTILLCPFGGFFIGSKNAMLLFAITSLIFFINVLLPSNRSFIRLQKKSLSTVGALLLVGVVGFYGLNQHVERTNSWLVMSDNIQIGMDIDHHDFWKNREAFPRPINKQGMPVDISTYERTAWFTAGSRLLLENPLGYGLVHHSFGSLALAKWPDFYKPLGNLKGATHSGWLDLALGIGLPGVALILISLLASWRNSMNRSGLWHSYATWTIPLLILTYANSEISESHFLELLLFMTAFFGGLTFISPKPTVTYVQKS